MKERALLLVDGNNLLHATSYQNRKLDYRRMRERAACNRLITKAIYYGVRKEDSATQDAFFKMLRSLEFEIEGRGMKQAELKAGEANLDVMIATDIFLYVDDYDVLVLVSGDGDFEYCIQALRKKYSKRVEVMAYKNTVAAALCRVADRFIDLDQFEFVPDDVSDANDTEPNEPSANLVLAGIRGAHRNSSK